jgi:endonuclease/exonuclease/phosphatase family metal-dependent hydrolase
VQVRVVTFNLLHGVPLRDRIAAARAGSGSREGEVPEQGAPQALPDGSTAGVEQMNRHVWSPEVPDPSELLRSVEELLEDGPIDVIALQEVDRFQPRTGDVDQARLVAEAIGARHWRFASSVRGTPGIASEGAAWVPATSADDLPEDTSEPVKAPKAADRDGPRYGISLISRYPVRQWRVKRFPPAPVSLPLMAPTANGRPRAVRVPDEPRAAISAILELPHADVTVATAHLTFVPGYNTRQLTELRAFLAGMPRPMVLLGDFNTPGGIPGLVTGWNQVARTPTYPVARPRVQFDHIVADGWTEDAFARARSSVRAVQLPVSDHCALLADFPEP